VAGPRGIEASVLAALEALYPGTRDAVSTRVPVRFVELESRRELPLHGVLVTTMGVEHSEKTPCLGIRVALDRKVIAYSGDTGWTPALVELCRGADLFVCECTGFDQPLYSHLSHVELTTHASEFDGVRIAHAPWSAHAGPCGGSAVALRRRRDGHRGVMPALRSPRPTAGSRSHGTGTGG
jgi:hypothetical protein